MLESCEIEDCIGQNKGKAFIVTVYYKNGGAHSFTVRKIIDKRTSNKIDADEGRAYIG